MADKELRLLQEGDEITTIWYMSTASGDDEFEPYTAATVTVTADTAFGEIELPDGSYSMVYEMRDAMDNYATVPMVKSIRPSMWTNCYWNELREISNSSSHKTRCFRIR